VSASLIKTIALSGLAVLAGLGAGNFSHRDAPAAVEKSAPRSKLTALDQRPSLDPSGLLEKLEALDVARFPALLDRMKRLPSVRAGFAMRLTMEIWAQQDPESALAYLGSLDGSLAFHDELSDAVFRAWGARDVEAAIVASGELPDRKLSALAGYAAGDPAAAWALTDELFTGELQSSFIKSVFKSWGRTNVGDAMSAMRALHDDWKPTALIGFSEVAFRDDPDRVWGFTHELGYNFPIDQFVAWLDTDPRDAGAFAARLEVEDNQKWDLLKAWIVVDPKAALAYLRSFPADSRLHRVLIREFTSAPELLSDADILQAGLISDFPLARYQELARHSPELLGWQGDGDLNEEVGLSYSLGSAWARENPQGGLRWLEGLESEEREIAAAGFYDSWVVDDVAAATEQLLKEEPGSRHFETLVGEDGGSHYTERHLTTLEPMVRGWLLGMSNFDRAEFISSQFEGYYFVAERFPELAKTWVMELPAGEARADAVKSVLNAFEMENPDSLRDWFGELPGDVKRSFFKDGPNSDLKFTGAEDVARLEILNYAMQLDDPASRIAAMVGSISRQNPFGQVESVNYAERAALAEAIQSSNLPEFEKALVQERIDSSP
jgi:hypothetical protein